MRNTADTFAPPRRADIARIAPYALVVGVVVLAWQIAMQPFVQRGPVEAAIRIAPASPWVLRRAAEAELTAGRNANAAALGRDALGRSPFDVRALRVVGLTEARAGRVEQADSILTLAGNWSLRDDPTHAWLVAHRLRRGDYASAFAHADTLARRRQDTHPPVFRLFTVAAAQDPDRALPQVASLLAAQPPWRSAYLTSVYDTTEGLQIAARLAIMLQDSRAPLTTAELQQLYMRLLDRGQIEAVKTVRARLNRPIPRLVTNGDFDDAAAPEPFQWHLIQKAGAAAAIMEGDGGSGDAALRIEYDGYSAAVMARQRTFLEPGRYSFSAESRTEAGNPTGRMAWTITCATGGEPLVSAPAIPAGLTRRGIWAASTTDFLVPEGCASQWLELQGRPLDRREPMVAWFDRIFIAPFVS